MTKTFIFSHVMWPEDISKHNAITQKLILGCFFSTFEIANCLAQRLKSAVNLCCLFKDSGGRATSGLLQDLMETRCITSMTQRREQPYSETWEQQKQQQELHKPHCQEAKTEKAKLEQGTAARAYVG